MKNLNNFKPSITNAFNQKIHLPKQKYNQEGSLVLTKKANNGVGKKVLTIQGSELKGNGTYFYSLAVNGQIVDSKMMLYVAAE